MVYLFLMYNVMVFDICRIRIKRGIYIKKEVLLKFLLYILIIKLIMLNSKKLID